MFLFVPYSSHSCLSVVVFLTSCSFSGEASQPFITGTVPMSQVEWELLVLYWALMAAAGAVALLWIQTPSTNPTLDEARSEEVTVHVSCVKAAKWSRVCRLERSADCLTVLNWWIWSKSSQLLRGFNFIISQVWSFWVMVFKAELDVVLENRSVCDAGYNFNMWSQPCFLC